MCKTVCAKYSIVLHLCKFCNVFWSAILYSDWKYWQTLQIQISPHYFEFHLKYRDEDDEAAVAEEHFKEKKSKTQPRTKNIRSKAELEKNEDEDFLIKAISAARATSSAVPVVSVDDQLRLQNNLARLELEKIQASHEATLSHEGTGFIHTLFCNLLAFVLFKTLRASKE